MSTEHRAEIIRDTLRGLGQRRRWLPILCLCLPVCAFELWTTRHWKSVLIPLLMSVALPIAAPLSWRLLFSRQRSGFELRLLAYLSAGVGCVALLGGLLPWLMGVPWSFVTDPASLLLASLIFWVGGWTLGRDIDLEQHLARAIAYGESKALQAEHAQLLAIRRHLDPHFLYNTLNALAEWCQQDPSVAEEGILQLSRMLRVLLDGIEQPTWPLSQELAQVQTLIDLYRLRDPDRLNGTITIAGHTLYDTTSDTTAASHRLSQTPAVKQLQDVPVPPMALLSLVENAIKHGPWSGHRGTVEVSIEQHHGQLQIDISNPGACEPAETALTNDDTNAGEAAPEGAHHADGKGLPLLRKRLSLLYGEGASCRLWGENDRTIARLLLPLPTQIQVDAKERPEERGERA